MASEAIDNALKRRAELQREIDEIDLYVRLHKKFSNGSMNDEHAANEPRNSEPLDNEPKPGRDGSHGRKRGRPDDFADQMELVLSEIGHPLSRPRMVEEMEKRKVDIPSDDKERYLGTILWRNKARFVSLRKFGYWIAANPYPQAGYDPATPPDSRYDRA
jgi:hypothetical protein